MGINKLWKIVQPAAQRRSLLELSVKEGFQVKRHGTGILVVGIDASPWFYASQAIFAGRSHAQAGQNPELRMLFFRLAMLSRCGISAVFVFDGPSRPKTKRGRNVRTAPHWMTTAFKELIRGFGFHYHTAPGEAEAELAYLNQIEAVDVVLTTDSDAFLFGAKQVMRSNLKDTKDTDAVEIYTSDALSRQPNSAVFSPAGLLFMAIVCGGDYDMNGVTGCGIKTACALASGPLAGQLLEAVQKYDGDVLKIFLHDWRIQLQDELANDSRGTIGRKYPNVAAKIPGTFPDPDIVKMYCYPVTSQSKPGSSLRYNEWHASNVPNTSRLAPTCARLFGWGTTIVDRFTSNVWDGYFIRKFVQELNSDIHANKSAIRFIRRAKISPSHSYLSYQVMVWMSPLVTEAAQAVVINNGVPPSSINGLSSAIQMTVWIPAAIMEEFANEKITHFYTENPCVTFAEQMQPYTRVLTE